MTILPPPKALNVRCSKAHCPAKTKPRPATQSEGENNARRLQARLDRQAEIAEMRATIDTQWKVIEALCAAKPDLQSRADASHLYERVRPRLDKFGAQKDEPTPPPETLDPAKVSHRLGSKRTRRMKEAEIDETERETAAYRRKIAETDRKLAMAKHMIAANEREHARIYAELSPWGCAELNVRLFPSRALRRLRRSPKT